MKGDDVGHSQETASRPASIFSASGFNRPHPERTVLAVCCVCGLIRDESESSADRERWVTPETYRQTRGVNPVDYPLTHTYCPGCYIQLMRRIRAV